MNSYIYVCHDCGKSFDDDEMGLVPTCPRCESTSNHPIMEYDNGEDNGEDDGEPDFTLDDLEWDETYPELTE